MPPTSSACSRSNWDKKEKTFALNLDDEIIRGCLVTHGGRIVNEKLSS